VTSYIRVERARQVARLIGELGEIGPATEAGRQHVADSLLKVVGAAVGAFVFDPTFRPAAGPSEKTITHSGFDEGTLSVLFHSDAEGCATIPSAAATMRLLSLASNPARITATHRELLPQRKWDRSLWVNDCARPAGLDHFLSSVLPIEEGVVEASGFMREARDAPFSVEDRELLHMFLEATGRFFRNLDAPKAPRVQLAPRVSEALAELLTGAADKEIAARLGISVHTARQYVKTIFRAYSVNSRAQLLARYHGNDAPHLAA
jgi:DNA-binding CsgD family transcriptional regulator